MTSQSLGEVKQELAALSATELQELVTRLARFKKENKELICYLLFQAHDMDGYVGMIKNDVNGMFGEINTSTLYFVKKSLRKILRNINRYVKYTASKQAEADLLVHFCAMLQQSGIPFHKSTAIVNMYKQQLKKIKAAVSTMHEDLQFDYLKQLSHLNNSV